MKYLIEVPDETGQAYYNIAPYTEPNQKAIDLQHAHDIENVARMNYSKGAEDAWELARRIICPSDCCEDSISAHTKEIFNKEGWEIRSIFKDLSYQEAKAKYESWKRKKEEIRVGDEVVYADDPNKEKAIVLRLYQPKQYKTLADILCEDGTVEKMIVVENLACTGRHFDEVEELLKKMREE